MGISRDSIGVFRSFSLRLCLSEHFSFDSSGFRQSTDTFCMTSAFNVIYDPISEFVEYHSLACCFRILRAR